MNQKSETCFGKKTGKPLTEYDSQSDAQESADYANGRYRQNMVPYQCDECGLWHLSPMDRQTPSVKCTRCTSADGNPKDTYQNREQAQLRADILRREQGAALKVYACEYGNGWHLTRNFR